jgi:hypothetical protein
MGKIREFVLLASKYGVITVENEFEIACQVAIHDLCFGEWLVNSKGIKFSENERETREMYDELCTEENFILYLRDYNIREEAKRKEAEERELKHKSMWVNVLCNTGKEDKIHFTLKFTTGEQKSLFDGLINGGFLPKETIYSHFCYVFRSMAIPDNEKPFERLQWIKTNGTTNGAKPNKKSLLDLLTILGIPETEIKQKINQLFIIPNGVTFRSNNYIYSHGKLNTISEYHNELVEIVNQSKKK